MGILKEFRDFAVKGNVIDMAVGIIIGGAFGTIVSSLVSDVMMPPLGYIMGQVDFSDLALRLKDATPVMANGVPVVGADGKPKVDPEVVIKYGVFINAVIKFIIVAFAVFILVKAINTARKKLEKEAAAAAPAPPPGPTPTELLLAEIRDELKAQR
ncbi:MAG: large-conductance mechanosensitive channel protein MscL [Planctomycetota bacterium]|nr:large-conductance mechanosensitive channel protein MscL [Planctomycetota bacterium]